MRRWMNMAALLALCAVVYALARNGGGGQSTAFLLYGCAVWLVFALGSSLLVLRGIHGESRLEADRAYAGGALRVSVRLRHRSFWPVVWLVAKETWRHSDGTKVEYRQLLFPWFRSELMLQYRLENLHRGEYRSEGWELHTGDLFGLVQIIRRQRRRGEHAGGGRGPSFLVYPVPESPRGRLLAGPNEDGTVGRVAVSLRDSALLRGTRPYEAGDPLRRIHWKLSARTGELQTKLFEPAASKRVHVLLDATVDSYQGASGKVLFEAAMRTAAGLARRVVGDDAGLAQLHVCGERGGVNGVASASYGGAMFAAGTVDELRHVYEWLSRMQPDMRMPFGDGLLQAVYALPPHATLAIVTPLAGPALLPALLRLKALGCSCTVVLVHAAPSASWAHRQWQKELAALGCGFADVAAAPDKPTVAAAPASLSFEGGAARGTSF
ncbi:DUF58 domain-containing protein [Paenibacillus koleovorans]|uniref:DUF58 domain-containing protein n=1 Tax=Paenibacillus koleovorans TaxID=121608 RepID=UPI000FDC3CBC|nr:DUF58 domain-containing protein [Paenibacillus koleovorans]